MPDAVAVLAVVQVRVLVAQDRQPGLLQLGVAADEFRRPARSSRTGGPAAAAGRPSRPSRRSPGPRTRRTDTTTSAGITPSVVRTPVTRPPDCSTPRHPDVAPELRARGLGAADQRDHRARRPWPDRRSGCAARRGPARGPAAGAVATHSSALIDLGLRRPTRWPSPAGGADLGEPFGGGGDLQPADLVEAPGAVDVEALENLSTV